jgi:hypothetical protein
VFGLSPVILLEGILIGWNKEGRIRIEDWHFLERIPNDLLLDLEFLG